ncbi:hypothetical protein Tco_0855021 [Tanacetum coccineum]
MIVDIEDDIMDPVMQCTTLPSHSGFSQKKLVSFVTEIHTSYALSWKPCQGDSLNLPDHRAQVDQGIQIKMIQVKEMMQDNDLKNSKSKDKGSKSRSQSMDEQSHYKQDKTITRQSINVKRHIFNVIGGTEEFEERDLNIGGDKSIGQTQTVKMMQQVQGMIKMIDDADIRPIYDEEPMAKGRVDQYPETCQVKSPMLDSSPDNQTTEYSKQSLESKTTEQTTSLLANNAELKAQIQEKVFAIAALKNDLRKLKGNSVDTKFDKTSVLGKPVLPSLRNQSVVRQPHAFKSAWAQMSKQRYINQCLEGTTSIDYVQNTIVKVDSPDDATDIMMSVHNSSGSSQCQNVV